MNRSLSRSVGHQYTSGLDSIECVRTPQYPKAEQQTFRGHLTLPPMLFTPQAAVASPIGSISRAPGPPSPFTCQ